MKFSVLISVYKNDDPSLLTKAIESISIGQTIQPDQIVMVIDGPVSSELENTITQLVNIHFNIHLLKLDENVGLARALNHGLKYCKNEIVCRMDSDDYSLPNRFEKQLVVFENNPDAVVVGAQISEIDPISHLHTGTRTVPLTFDEIKSFSVSRNPLNHMTVAFKKSEILKVNNYEHLLFLEDYYLWLRLISKNKKIINLPDILVYATAGNGMLARRGGLQYIKSEFFLFRAKNNLEIGNYFINTYFFFLRVFPRLLPIFLRGWVYKFLRGK